VGISSWLVLAAGVIGVTGLAAAVRRREDEVAPPEFAPPRRGFSGAVIYSFSLAFAPWIKESARRHLIAYLAGVVFHVAAFAAVVVAVASTVPALNADEPRPLVAALFGAGLAAGLGLFARRVAEAQLRQLSVPDDFVANLLVSGLLATATAAALQPHLIEAQRVAAAVLLLYLPVGKLRHMVFLVISRWRVARTMGRRGVLGAAGVRQR
jgi:hypothetical protein